MKINQNIIILAIISAFCLACGGKKQEAEESSVKQENAVAPDQVSLTNAQLNNAGIVIGSPETKSMYKTLNVNGVVDVPPENIYSVSVPMGGYISKMNLIPGMLVKKGSVLASVEDQQYIQLQQDFLTAKNRLKFSEADYVRQKMLNQTKATSDKIFQQTESEFNNQKILVSALAEKLRLIGLNPAKLSESNISKTIRIYAPISGYLSKVNINTGKYVNATDVLFELINPSALHVSLTVFEQDAANLKIGQKIVCTTSNNPDKKYFATIHLITPNIESDRSTSVHCDLENFDQNLLPGTFLNAAIQLNGANVQAVPDDAIVKWENQYYVFAQTAKGQFKMIGVETGATLAGYTAIKPKSALQNIVVKNAYAVLMKLKNSGEEG
ncbi:efflux RND transporter periplasmic adaptor subunit [Pedobacter sp. HDW13]|uniref:efflux RND transporter periplasmic adaptor subunit n=1 Tax=unclassified Pedobacter TaxID=2628915 RepID=UPI000F5B780B|nr:MULTISPECIES: efflux RND transporter periplasmic adaptor subunit [unclassified Pedobacter]QIL42294.1 efflux RND transporter periplasmic adaptor subunit [Pedobacter sp. HDW13]RQO76462.1 efflux transporter periplasmic adaptor subunit [Pedobacter sp. KBW01]